MAYTQEDRRQMLVGQCFNASAQLLAATLAGNKNDAVSVGMVYDYALLLYEEGMKRNWLQTGFVKDERTFASDGTITYTTTHIDKAIDRAKQIVNQKNLTGQSGATLTEKEFEAQAEASAMEEADAQMKELRDDKNEELEV